jgi:hypothetical protein
VGDAPPDLRCSFCSIDNRLAARLIAGPQVFICQACVELCCEIIAGEVAEGTRLDLLGERTNAIAALTAERDAAKSERDAAVAEARRYRCALVKAGNTIAEVTVQPFTRCMWCRTELDGEEAARQHVATCELHPAVIRLRQAEALRQVEARQLEALAAEPKRKRRR